MDFINIMGLYPKLKVAKQLFKVLDIDNSKSLEFREIIFYLEIIIQGNVSEKIDFVFDFVTNRN